MLTKRNKEILVLAESFFLHEKNGLARVAWDVSNALTELGNTVTLACLSNTEIDAQVYGKRLTAVTAKRPRVSSWNPFNPLIRIRSLEKSLGRITKQQQWDAIVCHGTYTTLAAYRLVARAIPLFRIVHSPAPYEQYISWRHDSATTAMRLASLPLLHYLEQKSLEVTAANTCLSLYTKNLIERLYGVRIARKTALIPHWPSIHPSSPKALTAHGRRHPTRSQPTVLCVRALNHRCGVLQFVRELTKKNSARSFTLVVIGKGPLHKQINDAFGLLPKNISPKLVPEVTDVMLSHYYAMADVSIIPSISLEGFGLPALESLSAGTPVLATSVGALPEILSRFKPSLLSPQNNIEHLTQNLLDCLNKPTSLPSPAECMKYTNSHFNKAENAARYDELLGGSSHFT